MGIGESWIKVTASGSRQKQKVILLWACSSEIGAVSGKGSHSRNKTEKEKTSEEEDRERHGWIMLIKARTGPTLRRQYERQLIEKTGEVWFTVRPTEGDCHNRTIVVEGS